MISKTFCHNKTSKCSRWILPRAQFSSSLVHTCIQQALSSGWATTWFPLQDVSVCFRTAQYHTIPISDLEWNNHTQRTQWIEHVAMCTKSIKLHWLLLLDSVLHSIAQWIEHVAMCTKSIKLHRLLLLDSVLHSIAQRIEHLAVCTKSIKLHRLLLLDSGLCISKPWLLPAFGTVPIPCWWILEELGRFLAIIPVGFGLWESKSAQVHVLTLSWKFENSCPLISPLSSLGVPGPPGPWLLAGELLGIPSISPEIKIIHENSY